MQAVRLLKKANPAVLAREVAKRDLRAAAYFPFGCYEGIAFSHELGATNYQAMSASLSTSNCQPPDCVGGISVGSFLSHDTKQDVVTFAVLDAHPGQLGDVLGQLEEARGTASSDLTVLYAPLLGGCGLRVVVEVMGSTEEGTLTQLQRMVDVRGLEHVSTVVTFGDLTWGFGSDADPVEGSELT